jgi:hypothetical protein
MSAPVSAMMASAVFWPTPGMVCNGQASAEKGFPAFTGPAGPNATNYLGGSEVSPERVYLR